MHTNNNKQGPLSSLFEQAANISKAHGYDILSEQVKELQQENTALKERISVLEDMERRFYLNVCRAYNAGKVNMANCVQGYADNDNDNADFQSSHDYFVGEFPNFKTNVP